MKFLQFPNLSQFNSYIDRLEYQRSIISGRMEAYSCKSRQVTDEFLVKQTYSNNGKKKNSSKTIEIPKGDGFNNFFNTNSVKTPLPIMTPPSPFDHGNGRFSKNFELRRQPEKFKTLVSTLSHSFSDYDFRDTTPEEFELVTDTKKILQMINGSFPMFKDNDKKAMWLIIEDIVDVPKSSIYRFYPSSSFEDEGKLWNWVYLFYNNKMKRVLLFTCSAKSIDTKVEDNDQVMEDDSETETNDLFDAEYYSNLKNVDYYYDIKKIQSSTSISNMMDDDEYEDDFNFEFGFDF